jgi:hypothetical protein
MPKQVSALLCVVEPDIEEFLTNQIKGVLPSGAALAVLCVKTLDEIMILSSNLRFGVAFILLNNIIVPPHIAYATSAIVAVKFLTEQGVPVIASCAWEAHRMKERALNAGARLYLPFPFTRQAIQSALRECLGLPAAETQAREPGPAHESPWPSRT